MSYFEYRPYVSVAERRRQAQREMERLKKKGKDIQPITIEGRKIATSFWGKAWCDHLESFSDYANRLPRGRSYVRNGSVCHLEMTTGNIESIVSGSELYNVNVSISTLPAAKWKALKERCQGQIGSLLELLQGRLSDSILNIVTDRKQGLFPLPGEIEFDCDCPDWASMCKHVAAVLYGVGSRLDQKPELLFLLRGVDHEDLITTDAESAIDNTLQAAGGKQLSTDELSDIFGIDFADPAEAASAEPPKKTTRRKKAAARKSKSEDKPAKKKSAKRKTAKPGTKKKTSASKKNRD